MKDSAGPHCTQPGATGEHATPGTTQGLPSESGADNSRSGVTDSRSQIALRQMVSDGQVDADVARADRRRDWPLRIDAGILRAEVRFKVRTLESVRCELIRRGMPAERADEWLRGACLEPAANPPEEPGDALIDALKPWVATQSKSFTMADALHHLGVEGPRETRDMHTRVGIALRKLGCIRPAQGLYIPTGVAPTALPDVQRWLADFEELDRIARAHDPKSRPQKSFVATAGRASRWQRACRALRTAVRQLAKGRVAV